MSRDGQPNTGSPDAGSRLDVPGSADMSIAPSDGTAEWSSVELAGAVDGRESSRKASRILPAVAVGLVGMLALFGIGATNVRDKVERNLLSQSEAALSAGGMAGVAVSYSGRDATIRVPAGTDKAAARRLILTAGAARDAPHYPGPRSAEVLIDANQSPIISTTTVPKSVGSVVATRNPDGNILFTGVVGSAEAEDALRAGAVQQSPATKLDFRTDVATGGVDARTATWIGRSIGELTRIGASSAQVTGSASGLIVSGAVPTLAVRDSVNAFVRTSGLPVTGSLAIFRPPDTLATGAGPDLFGEPVPAAGALQGEINALLAQSTIQFSPDSARLTKDSEVVVAKIAEFLSAAKKVRVEVVGHTDTNGSAERNLALSVARADAVRDELVASGVGGSRITTLGEGGTKPLVTNDSPANRRKNRRIEIKVSTD